MFLSIEKPNAIAHNIFAFVGTPALICLCCIATTAVLMKVGVPTKAKRIRLWDHLSRSLSVGKNLKII
jgi:hypothetical protein